MLLIDIDNDKRFVFQDDKTPLIIRHTEGMVQHVAKGTFVHVDTVDGTCPKLYHEETGKEFVAAYGTYFRVVLPILI